jgi:hypothetical protein
MIYDKELAAVGFSPAEIGAIEFVLLRMGVIPTCEHISRMVPSLRHSRSNRRTTDIYMTGDRALHGLVPDGPLVTVGTCC